MVARDVATNWNLFVPWSPTWQAVPRRYPLLRCWSYPSDVDFFSPHASHTVPMARLALLDTGSSSIKYTRNVQQIKKLPIRQKMAVNTDNAQLHAQLKIGKAWLHNSKYYCIKKLEGYQQNSSGQQSVRIICRKFNVWKVKKKCAGRGRIFGKLWALKRQTNAGGSELLLHLALLDTGETIVDITRL